MRKTDLVSPLIILDFIQPFETFVVLFYVYLRYNKHLLIKLWRWIIVNLVSERLLFNANPAIFQLYQGENKLIFKEMMMMRSVLYGPGQYNVFFRILSELVFGFKYTIAKKHLLWQICKENRANKKQLFHCYSSSLSHCDIYKV